MAEYTALAPLFTDIANAIRSKTGETGAITASSFPEKILSLKSISEYILDSKVGDNTNSIKFDNISYAPNYWRVIGFWYYPSIPDNAISFATAANRAYTTYGGIVNKSVVTYSLNEGVFRVNINMEYPVFSDKVGYYLIT